MPGERIVVATIDVGALRHERATRLGHHMSAHLRSEAYPVYRRSGFPPAADASAITYASNVARIDTRKRALDRGTAS